MNKIYPNAKDLFMKGDLDIDIDVIKVALIDLNIYTYDDAHENWEDAVAAVIGTPVVLAGITVTDGVFDGNNITFPTTSGNIANALILFKDTGDNANSSLVGYIDEGTGFPIQPNGGDININWDNGPNKIFLL